jgi:hypothetical protein
LIIDFSAAGLTTEVILTICSETGGAPEDVLDRLGLSFFPGLTVLP